MNVKEVRGSSGAIISSSGHLGEGKQLAPGAGIGAGEFPSGFAPHYALSMSGMPLMLRTGYLLAPGGNG